MRRWTIAVAAGAAVIAAATVYVRQPAPRSELGDALGIVGSRPFSRHCGWRVEDTRLGTWPTGVAVCAWYRPEAAHRRHELDQLRYHVVTRRVRSAERSWASVDTAAWRRDVDSVRAAFRARGGRPMRDPWSRGTEGDVWECWRFPDFDVRIHAVGGTGMPVVPTSRAIRGVLFLDGSRERLTACEGGETALR